MGDSNTKSLEFGSGKGKIGETYPGKRVKAAKIDNINPNSCIGYSNLVLVCGTNDLRDGYIKSDNDITNLVETYRNKLATIKQIAPATKVFVVPVLPTRNVNMNRNIVKFNACLDEMLHHCFSETWFPGVHGYLDNKMLLSTKFTREGDAIHLGVKGIAQFVRNMKMWIFQREVRERILTKNSRQAPGHKGGSPEPP
jgi:hypothetical protein